MTQRTCILPDCPSPHLARGLCNRHYKQAQASGMRPLPTRSTEELFWEKVIKGADCWIWTGGQKPNGYGYFGLNALGHFYVHRYSYELANGPIPKGLQIDHLCRVILCVRPEHLEAVTQQENLRRQRAAQSVT